MQVYELYTKRRRLTVKEDVVASTQVNDPEVAVNILRAYGLADRASEAVVILALNAKGKITGLFEASKGSLTESTFDPATVFKFALMANAHGIILAHNHPSGDCTPSAADIEVTKRAVKAGEILNIRVLDHVIVSEGEYFSMMKEELI